MSFVAATDAGRRLPELLDRVERGEEVVILRGGKAVARLTPVADAASPDPAALAELRALRERLRSEGVTFAAEEILALRDEGRR